MARPEPPAATEPRATVPPGYIALAGPTASGKTAAALAIAAELPVEIVSVDSALVYRGMDIGTAKPGAGERAAAPHHLIDIRDPLQAYSAAEFRADALALIGAIRARGRIPLLVGGTMLYFKALDQGLDDLPRADPGLRANLEARARAQGWPALHAELARVDPVTAARLAPNDSQRIQRALEVWHLTGQALSQLHAIHNRAINPYRTGAETGFDPHDSDTGPRLLLSLEPVDRAWLHQRIGERFDAMLAAGLLDEVLALRARGDLHPDLPSMRCVGYRQAWEALDGRWPLPELRERGAAATRQLAKRQITWLRASPQRHIVACDQPGAVSRVLALARGFAEGRS
ncbi:MAG: tRNA (adenosine(37)-N6)-dimethylallyltransferase MiaA [Rhodoferax sp.]|nr:tRNA (adenosine(37)-N6)-dimethylallyltransferase MiaA [Rhodoferax sp.]